MADPWWQIRPLELDDCDELGRVHIAVWREVYAGVMSDDYLAGLSAQRSSERWRSLLLEPTDVERGAVTLVPRDEAGAIVGFATAGPSRDEDPPTAWELIAINLLQRVHGTGLADVLVDRVVGDRPATLWVVEQNARARAFYERRGFVLEGARSVHEPTGTAEVRMIRR